MTAAEPARAQRPVAGSLRVLRWWATSSVQGPPPPLFAAKLAAGLAAIAPISRTAATNRRLLILQNIVVTSFPRPISVRGSKAAVTPP